MLKGFVAYSHFDDEIVVELRKHFDALEKEGLIRFWSDHRTSAGDDWEKRAARELVTSDVALFIVTSEMLRANSYLQTTELPAAELLHKLNRLHVWIALAREIAIGKRFPWTLEALPGKPPNCWIEAHQSLNTWCADVAGRIADAIRSGVVIEKLPHAKAVAEAIAKAREAIERFQGTLNPDVAVEFILSAAQANALEAALAAPRSDLIADVETAWATFSRSVQGTIDDELGRVIEDVTTAAKVAHYPLPISRASDRPLVSLDAALPLIDAMRPKIDHVDDEIQMLKQARRLSPEARDADNLIMGTASIAENKVGLVRGLIDAQELDVNGVVGAATDLDNVANGFATVIGSGGLGTGANLSAQAGRFQIATSALAQQARELGTTDLPETRNEQRTIIEKEVRDLILQKKPVPPQLAEQVRSLSFACSAPKASAQPLEWRVVACAVFHDLSPLRAIPHLERLSLHGTAVKDLGPLAAIRTLQQLNLSRTDVYDLTPLAHLPQLKKLDVSNSRVAGLAPLTTIHSLTHLDISDTLVASVAPIRTLSNLRSLAARTKRLTQIVALGDLAGLEELDLSGRRKGLDISPLSRLHKLKVLKLAGPNVTEIDSLVQIGPSLETLSLDSLRLVAPHSRLGKAMIIRLTGKTRPIDLEKISQLGGLRSLGLRNTMVKNADALHKLTHLTKLYLSSTSINDLSFVSRLFELRTLDLQGSNITDLSPLRNLWQLRQLYLADTKVADLSPLRNLDQLELVEITNISAKDLSPIAHVPRRVGAPMAQQST